LNYIIHQLPIDETINYNLQLSNMKKALLFLSTLLFTTILFGQNCEIPQELMDNYEKDVQYMAADFMAKNSDYDDIIEIPEYLTREIFAGLAAIYNSDQCDKQLVFDK